MSESSPFPSLLVEAYQRFQRGDWNGAIELLVRALEQNCLARGAADALGCIGKAHYKLQNAHQGEIACLVLYRLRATLISREQLFDGLANLIVFDLAQNSFDEAHAFGTIAERIRTDDSDLLANMVVACAMTDRKNEAVERFEWLKQIAEVKAGAVESYFTEDSPHLRPTRQDDCSRTLNQLLEILELQLVCSAGQPVNLLHYSSQLREAIRALDRSADGIKSHECWYLLCRIYANQIPGIRNEYLKLQTWAGLAAASGKALNTRPPNELGSVELWRWRGNALCQLCLYELAFKALDQVVAIGDATKEDSHAIELCHEMMTLDEADPRRPDSPASMGLIDYHLPRTTTDPTGGPARTIAASSKKRDPRSMLEEARILAREPNGFWPAYDHFTRALHQMGLSGEARLERNHELNQKAFSLFNTNKDEAIALLCEAVAYVPADMHSWQELGTIHFHKGRFAEAEEFQQRAIEIVKAMSPLPRNSGRYWFNMADCRLHSARSNPKLAEHDRQAKLLKAAEDARLAISLGDARGHLVLRQIAKETAVSPTKKRWWKFRK